MTGTLFFGLIRSGTWSSVGRPVVAPSVATVAWFGFATVYVPHSRHADRLMPYFTEHSGWHHDHHRAPQYPFNQYLELRDFHLRHGVLPWLCCPNRRLRSIIALDRAETKCVIV